MNSIRCLVAVGIVAISLVAFAQQAPLPAGTSASVAPARLQYRSAFEGYRAYQDPTARSWREVNEEAASLGGHAGHLKPAGTSTAPQVTKPEATGATGGAPPAAPPAAAATPTKPASAAHEGQGK